jgi:ABC-type antimicrobial peptide transport system permease subunit
MTDITQSQIFNFRQLK